MIQVNNSGTMANVYHSARISNANLREPTIQLIKSAKSVSHGTGCSSVISIQVDKYLNNNTTISIHSYDYDNDTIVTDVKTFTQLTSSTWIQSSLYGGINIPYNLSEHKTIVLMELTAEESTSIPKVYFVGFYEGAYKKTQPDDCIYGIKISCSATTVLDYELFNYDVIQNLGMVIDFNARKEINMICADCSSLGYETNNEEYVCGFMITGNDNATQRVLVTLFHANDDANDTYSIHIGTLNSIKVPGTSTVFTNVVLADNVSNFWDNVKAVAEYDIKEFDTASIQNQINELDDAVEELSGSLEDIQEEIDDIPSQIETAVDEATSSIMSSQAQLFVSR